MEIRNAEIDDLKKMLEIYDYAREEMIKNNNPNQWSKNYPNTEIVIEDIKNRNAYLVISGNEICGVFTFIIGEDETYKVIEDGEWLNDDEYGTLHRIASNNKASGVFREAILFCQSKIKNIRVDTHKDNLIMRKLLKKYGYKLCGKIYLEDKSMRIAYQKLV